MCEQEGEDQSWLDSGLDSKYSSQYFTKSKINLSTIIKHLNNKIKNFELLSDSSQRLKKVIHDKLEFEINKQILIFNGIKIDDEQPLSEYSIQNGSKIVLKLITNEELKWLKTYKLGFNAEVEATNKLKKY